MKPEAAAQKAILEYLAARHILAFRMNSGASQATYKGKTRLVRYGVPGMADILAFHTRERGTDDAGHWCDFTQITPLWIECKSPTGKQSDMQKSFQAQVEAAGHRYIVAKSVDDVEAALRKLQ